MVRAMVAAEHLLLAQEEDADLGPAETAREPAEGKIDLHRDVLEELLGALPLEFVRAEEVDPVPALELFLRVGHEGGQVPPVVPRRRGAEAHGAFPFELVDRDAARAREPFGEFPFPHVRLVGRREEIPLVARPRVALRDFLPEIGEGALDILGVDEDDDRRSVEVREERNDPVQGRRVMFHSEKGDPFLEALRRQHELRALLVARSRRLLPYALGETRDPFVRRGDVVGRVHAEALPRAGRPLRFDIEVAHRDDLVPVELHAHGSLLGHLEDVENPSADGELPLRLDRLVPLVAETDETLRQLVRVVLLAGANVDEKAEEELAGKYLLERGPDRADEHAAPALAERLERLHLEPGEAPVGIVVIVRENLVLGIRNDALHAEYPEILLDVARAHGIGGDDEKGGFSLGGERGDDERSRAAVESRDGDVRAFGRRAS